MTSFNLTRDQITDILTDMGWEHEDLISFLWLARKETREPGCLARKRQQIFRDAQLT